MTCFLIGFLGPTYRDSRRRGVAAAMGNAHKDLGNTELLDDLFRSAADGDDRPAHGHRLAQDATERLIVGRVDQDIHGLKNLAHVFDLFEPMERRAEAKGCDALMK